MFRTHSAARAATIAGRLSAGFTRLWLSAVLLVVVPIFGKSAVSAQGGPPTSPPVAPPVRGAPTPETPKSPAWYDRVRIRGYGQIRYNRLLENNPQLQCEQCDRSWGENGGAFIRRARVIVQGYVHPQLFIYLQPDFASTAGTTGNVAQLRDWYVDVGIDKANEFRLRVGQSKVPYSFENMQSSQNRLPLDRADATNSANANERDLGAFFMWAPKRTRERFAHLVNDNLKGSGDYGVVAVGVYNGQTANRPEANDNQHVVARVTYPFEVRGQIIEPSVAAYRGEYQITADQRTTGVKGNADWNYRDERVLTTVALAPQPFGILAEYNVGRGPEYNPATDSIETQTLRGGFITATYQVRTHGQVFSPFTRYQVYNGGKKHERDARSYDVNDFEIGMEWQPHGNFELVAAWYHGNRRFEDKTRPINTQVGRLMRLQAQFNF
ncbi:MAG: porin [Gemmatimonadaceae bacterium]|nr:porin [Gemmatimonadaceae bacterium]